MKDIETLVIKIVLIVMFLCCLFDMPYGYYQFIRFLGIIGFGFLAYHENKNNRQIWMYIWIASLILINPLFKVSLGRELWNIIDVVWALLLTVSIFQKRSI